MRLGIYKVRTSGLYEMGRGWVSNDAAQKWLKFWERLNYRTKEEKPAIFISYAPPAPHDVGCGSLVVTGGGGYLHPEGICLLDRKSGSSPTDGVAEELKRLFAEVCELCGGSFEFDSKIVEVDDSDMKVRI